MSEIILVPSTEANPSEQPGALGISATGASAIPVKATSETSCASAKPAHGEPGDSGSCTASATDEKKSLDSGSCATTPKSGTTDASSCATTEIPATAAATPGDSCCSEAKSGKPATSDAN